MQRISAALVVLLICSLQVNGTPTSVFYDEGFFSLRFFPLGTVTNDDCFTSTNCTRDQNVHFYLEEVYKNPLINGPCDFVDSLVHNPNVRSNSLVTLNGEKLDISIPSLLRLIFASETCDSDLLNALQPIGEFHQLFDLPKVEISIIESNVPVDLDYAPCRTECSPKGVIRLNIVISSWCDSTCAREDNCEGVELELEQNVMDYTIARFEVKQLLHVWNKYVAAVESELDELVAHKEDVTVPWGTVADIHTHANRCLRSGLSSGRPSGADMSLHTALTYLATQLDACPTPELA